VEECREKGTYGGGRDRREGREKKGRKIKGNSE